MYATLYSRAINGKIKVWMINDKVDNILVSYGYLGGNLINQRVIVTMKSSHSQVMSMIKKKTKEGYKSITDIINYHSKQGNHISEPTTITTSWLDKYLPSTNLDDNYNLKPMKCQKFRVDKMKYPAIAQPKYNGIRAVLRWERYEEGEGLFKNVSERAVFRSKSGLEYYLPRITNMLDKEFFIDKHTGLEVAYDGELYIHNTPLNVINSACPIVYENGVIAKSSNPVATDQIVFMVFDIATEDLGQYNRVKIYEQLPMLNNITPSEHIIVYNDSDVLEYTAKCIARGYEGAVVRDMDSEYKFGSRPMTMMKSKNFMDGEFKVVAILPKPKEPETSLFVLKNDINDNLFECNPVGSYEQRKKYLDNKDDYIGKMATVKYYERSGVNKVPFHSNVITIRDYE